MELYIDSQYKCHVSSGEGLREMNVDFFEGKCKTFIQGYRYIPDGESWTREDGQIFAGEMIAPAEDSRILEAAQTAYEEALDKNADALAALEVLGVQP